MHKILILLFLLFTSLYSSVFDDLILDDKDFIKIVSSKNKEFILNRIHKLIIMKESLKNTKSDFAKLVAVNNFFNNFNFKSDKEVYNKADYWATRKEFIIKGSGDCEDFVIAKYFTLIELGIDESKLSLLHNIYKDEYHMVLAYQKDKFSIPLLLDNINKNIMPLTQRNDILVLYTLERIDIKNQLNLNTDLFALSNYKWSKVYLKSIKK